MKIKYSVDFNKFTISKLRNLLRTTQLLPSQKILKEQLDESFDAIENEGIKNLDELQKVLKGKADVTSFSEKTGISEEFLTVLRREINSYNPKRRKLNEFPFVDSNLVSKLQAMDIKDTQEFFDRAAVIRDRTALAKSLDMDIEPILELTKLSDVIRLRYVNQAFATLLVKAGYDSVEKIARSSHDTMYADLKSLNAGNKYFKGAIGLNDMKLLITDAKEIPRTKVEY